MDLKAKIQEDLKKALMEKKETEVSTLRMLLAAIFNKEKEKRYKLSTEKPEFNQVELEKESRLTDEELLAVISSEVKKRKEAILEFERGDRQDLVSKEKGEMAILEKYLPEQLSDDEIRELAKKTIEEIKAEGTKDIGKVMAALMAKIKGKAEGGKVSQIVKDLLAKKE